MCWDLAGAGLGLCWCISMGIDAHMVHAWFAIRRNLHGSSVAVVFGSIY